jgi:soluble lytic murein transglycosylase-like protein
VLDLPPGLLPPAAQQWLPHIERVAREVGIDPRLLIAVVHQESDFRHDVPGAAGEIGLVQLMPGTAAEVGVNPYDPIDNLRGGARYLHKQLDRFGSVELALAAYNAGPGNVAGGRDYASEVLRFYIALGGMV